MQTHRWYYAVAAIGIGLFSIAILLSLPAAAQYPVPTVSSSVASSSNGEITLAPPANPSAVLYDQYDNAAASSSNSQNFESSLDTYDNFLADDFVIPAGEYWTLDLVEVQGVYFAGTGPADSMNVFIYTQAITVPGSLLVARADISYTTGSGGLFTMPLTPTISLGPGTYWLSVQANQTYSTTGEWGWTDRAITNTLPAAWQNPGGGFGVCQTWDRRTICVGHPAAGDQVFRLSGTSIPDVPLTCDPNNPWVLRSSLPRAVYGAGVASDGTYAYVIGGNNHATGVDITQTMRYDPETNAWVVLEPVPEARTMASVVYAPVNNKLYVFGGEIAQTGQVFSSTLIYDITGNSWATGASMPGVRDFMSAGYYNGKVYLAGGYSTSWVSITSTYTQTWEYNVTANSWITKTSMPEALGGAASAVVNGHLYVIGGRDSSSLARNQTYDYDIVHDTWSSRSNIPYGVNVAGAAVLQDKIWVIGGGAPFLATEGLPSPEAINTPETINTTMIFDPETNSWATGPGLNVPRSFVGTTGIGYYAVAIGGYAGSTATGATEVTTRCPELHFNPAGYTASENAGSVLLPVWLHPASSLTVTVGFTTLDGTAIAGSDYLARSGTLTFTPGTISQTFSLPILEDTLYEGEEILNLTLNTNVNATIVPPNPAMLKIIDNDSPQSLTCGFLAPSPWKLRNFLSQPVYGAGVANDGAYAYIIGGYTPQSSKDITQTVRYDPAANTWTALAPVPKAVSLSSVIYAPLNNKLYVFGGQLVSTGLVYSSTLIYDIASNTWSTGASMPGVRAFMSAGYYNGKVYLVGGYSSGSVTPSYSQTWEYNVTANTWTTKTSMPEGLGGAASAVVNGHLYVIGGRDGIIEARNQTYDYNIALDSWSVRANIPYGVNVPGVAVLHDKIMVIGGGSPFLTMGGTSTMADATGPQTINTTMIYNPAANSWAAGPNLNIPRSFIGGTGFGNYALAIGGYSSGYSTGATEVIWICPNGYLPVMMKVGP